MLNDHFRSIVLFELVRTKERGRKEGRVVRRKEGRKEGNHFSLPELLVNKFFHKILS